jgi:hypothetical protein
VLIAQHFLDQQVSIAVDLLPVDQRVVGQTGVVRADALRQGWS